MSKRIPFLLLATVGLTGCASGPGSREASVPASSRSAPLPDCTENEGRYPRISHDHHDWEPPCSVDLPEPGWQGRSHDPAPRSFRIPEQCTEILKVECGRMLNHVYVGLCISARNACFHAQKPSSMAAPREGPRSRR